MAAQAAEGCSAIGGPGTWSNQEFPDQTRRFHVEVDVTPSSTAIDAVVGLSDGSASGFSQLAAIVRFGPSGTIDARDGATYRASTFTYAAGQRYRVRFDVDVPTHTYSAYVGISGSYFLIGHSYAFRTEQAAVGRLNNLASEVDAAGGTLEVCGATAVADGSTAGGCWIASAGDGFVTVPLADVTALGAVQFSVRPSGQDLDAVIGLSAGPASRFADLATALRLSPAGVLDARDGDGYRADLQIAYDGAFDARIVADLTSHTYSVFHRVGEAQELARQYRFRTQQSGVGHLDHLGMIVDGAQGSIEVCNLLGEASSGVAYSREGGYAVAPLAGDGALLSDGATTTRVDTAGRVLASIARGGQLATDVLGNVFISRVDGNTLSVDKYDAGFAARWHATGTVLAGSTVTAMSADPTGAVSVGVVTPQDASVSVFRYTAGGAFVSQQWVGGNALAIDGDQPIVAWNDGPTLRITRYTAQGAIAWARAFTGNARITALAFDPSHDVLFGGELISSIDFGGGLLRTRSNSDAGPINGFIVKLSSTGAHVFSTKTGYSEVGGIAASDALVLVSSTEHTQNRFLHLHGYGPDGTPGGDRLFSTGLGGHGFGRRVTMGPSGRIWWNLETAWPSVWTWRYMVVIE